MSCGVEIGRPRCEGRTVSLEATEFTKSELGKACGTRYAPFQYSRAKHEFVLLFRGRGGRHDFDPQIQIPGASPDQVIAARQVALLPVKVAAARVRAQVIEMPTFPIHTPPPGRQRAVASLHTEDATIPPTISHV